MATADVVSEEPIKNIGWRVTFAGMGVNLALGILYTWSVISKGIPDAWNWSEAAKSLPYAIACLVFSIVMVPAGRLQDRIGPRLVASIGGVLVGLGMVLASLTTSVIGYVVGFGVLAGAGIGFGYASATPPAVKWFPAAKTGLIAGIVVSGFGLASVYAAPLAKYLVGAIGLEKAMLALGALFFVVVVGLAQLLRPPHKALQFAKGPGNVGSMKAEHAAGPPAKKEEFTPREMLRTTPFYVLWFMYACGAGAGLMIIAKLAAIAKQQAGLEPGFLLVAVLAVGNGAGRVIAGILSDKMGRKRILFMCFGAQAVMVVLLSMARVNTVLATMAVMIPLSALIGANYGANLALFPSIIKDYYGLKNFGVNYGLVFTAWGVGGFMLALLAGKIYDATKSFSYAYYGASGLLILAAAAVFFVKSPYHKVSATRID
ncbi:MAG: OFA family MFS transporter [Verrucomicrobiota bacterium]|nr:OFA family MFS transporter [Verrucomicrobiota bacterium]